MPRLIKNRQPHELRGMQVDADADTPTIYMYDVIGPSWAGMIDDQLFVDALEQIGDAPEIMLRINSPGGDVFKASTIYNLLRDHAAAITVRIDGVAASAASLIAMAGDRIEIASNAMVMIHQCSTIAWGNKDELRRATSMLEKADTQAVQTYVDRTGGDKNTIIDWLQAETWFTADEAVENGFADAKVGDVQNLKPAVPKGRFKNVPDVVEQYERTFPGMQLAPPPPRPDAAGQTDADQPAQRHHHAAIAARCRSVIASI
ncbi:ATP-dependent Clp protease proteolytic subunit 1 [Crateriforma conspicua]|uniref:ATP-dependent Clp protease proteolytic subunit n=1 Tax=Crateriforma conspicua TaxID=2527996 RepID=A0A5C6FWN2_9PLAN|nr:head maturation protease, ClpP-related [Crateriforma conspicua]TWU67299.1 ATP-dependent Clp protease proteolytic subunit 1 [Crateriforma conspicua]